MDITKPRIIAPKAYIEPVLLDDIAICLKVSVKKKNIMLKYAKELKIHKKKYNASTLSKKFPKDKILDSK